MHIVSWNVNGYRAIIGKPSWQWVAETQPDILGIQETKAELAQISEQDQNFLGYQSHWVSSQKKRGYSGVAAFSKHKPLAVNHELPDQTFQGEGRCVHLEMPDFHFLNIYFPNGQMNAERLEYKMGYYAAFLEYAETLRKTKPIVACGDFNTAHRPIDLARPKQNEETSGFLPQERAFLDLLTSKGYVDTFRHIHGDKPEQYSWWSYRLKARERNVGWRIDYFFISEELVPKLIDAQIYMNVEGSDHCPVGIKLDI